MVIFKTIILLCFAFPIIVRCDDAKEEEKDPWEKSTDHGHHNSEEPVRVDVTEVSESEVHSLKSKVLANEKPKILAKETPKTRQSEELREDVDEETKEQISDAVDETDPEHGEADTSGDDEDQPKHHRKHMVAKKQDFTSGSLWEYPYPFFHPQYACNNGKPGPCPKKEEDHGVPVPQSKKHHMKQPTHQKAETEYDATNDPRKTFSTKKQLNPHVDYHPGQFWEYPYPYYHPLYGCGKEGPCTKDDGKRSSKISKKGKKEQLAFTGSVNGTPPSNIAKEFTARCRFNKETKKISCKQLIPVHYYGPPSAGWGGFQPGHTGSGWGTPYWYKKCETPHCRQLIPVHYYGPPSAGWGGFQPGHTGSGWGTPYWYKKCEVPKVDCRQIIPAHYYGPPSAGWGGFQPGHTGSGWGTPYWYKKCEVPKVNCRQLIPVHYYGPASAGWGGFQPGHTGSGWGTPYWYKKCEIPRRNCRQIIPAHYYGPPSAGWGAFMPGHTGAGWGVPYWYKSTIMRPEKQKKVFRKWLVSGKDDAGIGHTGNNGWDSGSGKGFGYSWGEPNRYGDFPYDVSGCKQGLKQNCLSQGDAMPAALSMHNPVPSGYGSTEPGAHTENTATQNLEDYGVDIPRHFTKTGSKENHSFNDTITTKHAEVIMKTDHPSSLILPRNQTQFKKSKFLPRLLHLAEHIRNTKTELRKFVNSTVKANGRNIIPPDVDNLQKYAMILLPGQQ